MHYKVQVYHAGHNGLYIMMSLASAGIMQSIGNYLSPRLSYVAADLSAYGTLSSGAAILVVSLIAIERIEL
jgi:hypothetical protein